MSLVSEALRKARAEAAAREAARRGETLPGTSWAGTRRRRIGPVIAVGAALLVAAITGGAAAWWLASARSDSVVPVTAAPLGAGALAERPEAQVPASVGGHRTGAAQDQDEIDGARPRERADAGQERPPATPATQPTPTGPLPDAGAAAPRPDPIATGVPAPARIGGPAPERVHVLVAELGYARVALDFIVYKPSAPFARINGQHVIPGSVVDGFRVDEIGEDFIRLRDGRGPLVLRVR